MVLSAAQNGECSAVLFGGLGSRQLQTRILILVER